MKKFRLLAMLLALVLALSLVLTGCGGGETPSGDDGGNDAGTEQGTGDEGGSAGGKYATPEGETRPQFMKRFREAIEEWAAEEYKDKLDMNATAVQDKLDYLKKHMSYGSDFKKAPEDTLAAMMAEFKSFQAFRSEGSLIGPEAPATADEAAAFIKEEFAAYINDDTQASVDAAIDGMADYNQASFDAARRALWDEFGCDADVDTYWQGAADEDDAE